MKISFHLQKLFQKFQDKIRQEHLADFKRNIETEQLTFKIPLLFLLEQQALPADVHRQFFLQIFQGWKSVKIAREGKVPPNPPKLQNAAPCILETDRTFYKKLHQKRYKKKPEFHLSLFQQFF